MATWAIGDVHGCYRSLCRLVGRLRPVPGRDRLWLTGDLVNRGPRSLAVLRWAREHDELVTVVLGNHDLHLLARAAGVAESRKRDSLEEVLAARDREELLAWLAARPLMVRERRWLLVHAGLDPRWTATAAEKLARRVERALAGRYGEDYLAAFPARHGEARLPRGVDRSLLRALRALVLMRICNRRRKPQFGFTARPAEAPAGCLPWFDVPGRRSARSRIVCGHWAALGLYLRRDLMALDTGCAWGGALTALRLEDGRVVQQANLD
jgi:bis(5'-nucleosyl)-tetraphosphatase (symmetrical)